MICINLIQMQQDLSDIVNDHCTIITSIDLKKKKILKL